MNAKRYLILFCFTLLTISIGQAGLRCAQCNCCASRQTVIAKRSIPCCSEETLASYFFPRSNSPIPPVCPCSPHTVEAFIVNLKEKSVLFVPIDFHVEFRSLPVCCPPLFEEPSPGLAYGRLAGTQSLLCRLNC